MNQEFTISTSPALFLNSSAELRMKHYCDVSGTANFRHMQESPPPTHLVTVNNKRPLSPSLLVDQFFFPLPLPHILVLDHRQNASKPRIQAALSSY